MMNTIQAMRNDVLLEIDFVKQFAAQKKQSAKKQKEMIFCGSGDSLCTAMLAESFSDFRVRALDPLDMAKNKTLAKNHAYFVSISGNTISTVMASKIAKNSTAITKNPSGKLAKACKKTILLEHGDSGILTAGTIGFLSSALTCISLVYDFTIKNVDTIFEDAKSQSQIIPRNKIYFLGNHMTYPIAMYASAKLGEVFGIDSHYERIEQFSHMGLFTAGPGDTIIILEQKNPHNSKLKIKLENLGLAVHNLSIDSKNKVDQILFYIFASQLMPLHMAKKKRTKDCYFIAQKKIRAASSAMIY